MVNTFAVHRPGFFVLEDFHIDIRDLDEREPEEAEIIQAVRIADNAIRKMMGAK